MNTFHIDYDRNINFKRNIQFNIIIRDKYIPLNSFISIYNIIRVIMTKQWKYKDPTPFADKKEKDYQEEVNYNERLYNLIRTLEQRVAHLELKQENDNQQLRAYTQCLFDKMDAIDGTE